MKKILLIEDDSFLVEIYTTKFKESGFEIENLNNSEIALSYIRESKPDLILLDVVMPKMDGFELMRKIKEENDLKIIPIIFLTNLGQKEDIEKGLGLGAVDYVVKAHFMPSEIVDRVKKILKS